MKPSLRLDISDQSNIAAYAKAILDFAGDVKIVLFEAPMGAGKTTLIKEICKHLGSHDHFSSPTYSIINEYDYPGGKIYHFDLFRLNGREELLDLGVEDYLNSGNYCFFEWPGLVEDLIDRNYVMIRMTVSENIRYLHASLL